MSLRYHLLSTTLCLSAALAIAVPAAWAQQAEGQQPAPPSATPPATAKAGRSMQEIQKDISAASKELQGVLSSPNDLLDPAKRAEVAPKAVPSFRKMITLMEELGQVSPQFKPAMESSRFQILGMMTMLGDQEAGNTLKQAAGSSEPQTQLGAKSALIMADWIKNSKDAAAQAKTLDEAQALVKAHPDDQQTAMLVMSLGSMGAASPELKERANALAGDLKGPLAEQMKQRMASAQKMQAMENKPLVLEGLALDGKKFSTADWKGKVVLVDFWATWCGPCIAELPRVKKVYSQYHDKGLEILGVSCDNSVDDLKKFLAENKEMAWPQLFDPSSPGWHPLAKQYGIEGIPTMFLIDKNGVLRSVEARSNFETEIPKLLAEQSK